MKKKEKERLVVTVATETGFIHVIFPTLYLKKGPTFFPLVLTKRKQALTAHSVSLQSFTGLP